MQHLAHQLAKPSHCSLVWELTLHEELVTITIKELVPRGSDGRNRIRSTDSTARKQRSFEHYLGEHLVSILELSNRLWMYFGRVIANVVLIS